MKLETKQKALNPKQFQNPKVRDSKAFGFWFFNFWRGRQRGQVLVFLLLIMISLSATALLYNRFFVNEAKTIIAVRNSSQALASADLGLERLMFYRLSRNTNRCDTLSSFDGCQNPYACTRTTPCLEGDLKYYYTSLPQGIVISSGSFEGIIRTFLCVECAD